MESWVFLLVGSVGAVGAAMVVGTVGALVGWYRNGTLPNQGSEGMPVPSERTIRLLWFRIGVGVVVAVAALLVLQGQGLL
jgi:hypothetical protein